MAAPSTAITRLDLSMSYGEFNLAANQQRFIGLQVLPPLAVEQEASEFAKLPVKELLTKIEDTRRAPRTAYAEDAFEWTTDSYALTEHGVVETVDDASVERYGDVVRAEVIAANRAINRVLQRLEYDIATACELSGNNGGSNAVGTAWSTPENADPIADIDAAHDRLETNCGSTGNTLVLTRKNFRAMIRTDRLESLLKYDASELLLALQSGQQQEMTSQVLSGVKSLLQVDRILVGRGKKNTADKGQTASMAGIWDDTKAHLCVTNDDGMAGDLENPQPQWGRVIFSTKNDEPLPGAADAGLGSLIMEEFRDEVVRGSKIRPRNKRQVKILHTACSEQLTGVTT